MPVATTPKADIRKIGQHWRLVFYKPSAQGHGLQAVTQLFISYSGASHFWNSHREQALRECKAFAILRTVVIDLLTVREFEFVKKLQKSKCIGISRRGYGYLKGIEERQKCQ